MCSLRSTSLARSATMVGAIVAVVVSIAVSSGHSDAAPSNDRAHHGYDSVGTNGFGATESWAGNLRLFTGPDQTGEAFVGYCIQRGLNYPRGTDPQFADANSGFALVGDVPAQRGVSGADRAALAYALWRHGATTDDRTAAAMFLLTHLLSADPDFGAATLESTVLGPDWPEPAAVMARAREILDESRARRGPWTIGVEVRPADGVAGGTVVAELTGPGGPIGGVDVVLTIDLGGGDAVEAVLETGDDGRVAHAVDVTDVSPPEFGDADHVDDAPDVTEVAPPDEADAAADLEMLDHEVAFVDVSVTATAAATPGGYRVFHGRPGTQQVITDDGDGPPVSASTVGQVTVPTPPPPATTTTAPETTTTTVVTTTTVPETTTTMPPTTVPTTSMQSEPPPTTAAPTTAAPTTAAPAAPGPVTERPAHPVSVAEPALADTGGALHLVPVGLLVLALGSTMVGAAQRIRRVPVRTAASGRRRGGAHLR